MKPDVNLNMSGKGAKDQGNPPKTQNIPKVVSPLGNKNAPTKPIESPITTMAVSRNLDRRISRSTESINPTFETSLNVQSPGHTETFPVLTNTPSTGDTNKPFAAHPAQKTMAEALAKASEKRIPHTNTKPNSSPSSSTNSHIFPTKEHAFLVQAIESVSIHQYLRAVADVVGAENIWFGSRLSQGRIAIYLASVRLVDRFMADEGGITIGDQFISARRMVTKANRLVLSNVCPTIPHSVIEEALSSAVKVVSPMTFISVGGKDPEISKIFSFRRQIFVVMDENHQLPDSFLVEHDGDHYRIFLSFDDLRCFKCRRNGHIARTCPQNQTIETASENEEDCESPLKQKRNKRKAPTTSTPSTDSQDEQPADNQTQGENSTQETAEKSATEEVSVPTKDSTLPADRANMDTAIEDMLEDVEKREKVHTPTENKPNDNRPKAKRQRKEDYTEHKPKEKATDLPSDAMETLQNPDLNHVLTAEEFLAFLKDVKGNDHPMKIARRYTEDTLGLISMLEAVQPKLITARAVRERVRRLIANLRKIHGAENEDNVSLARSTSLESVRSSSSLFLE